MMGGGTGETKNILEVQRRLKKLNQDYKEKISRHSEGLVVAFSRGYQGNFLMPHSPPDNYNIKRLLEVGTISPETVFGNHLNKGIYPFVDKLGSAFYLSKGEFIEVSPPVFNGAGQGGLLLLASMDEPPELLKIDWRDYENPNSYMNIYSELVRLFNKQEIQDLNCILGILWLFLI